VDVRRADDRFVTRTDWLVSRHSFSFGQHYDPTNTGFGLLVANNDDTVAPGAGYGTHQHRDMEVVTWVLRGALSHEDSTGCRGRIRPGLAQRMSAGTGIVHSERNAADGLRVPQPVRFVQMWVLPDTPSVEPGYEQSEVDLAGLSQGWSTVASGMRRDAAAAAVRIHQRDAALHATRLSAGEQADLPSAPYVHLYVAVGGVDLDGAGHLDEGDAVRVTGGGGQRLTATGSTELLAWEMHAGRVA